MQNHQTVQSNFATRSRKATAGFTLIEVILAIALAGFILAAATTILVSISRIWVDREGRNFFEDHVDGVVEFLQSSFTAAGMEIALGENTTDTQTNDDTSGDNVENGIQINIDNGGNGENGSTTTENSQESASGGLLRVSEEPVGWANPPGFADYKDPLLNFKLTTTPPLLVNLDNGPTIGVDAFLHFDRDDGLSLLWYSLLQEKAEDIDDLRRTEISPLVSEIRYIYWDERFEKWEEETEPKDGEGNDEYLLPRFIKLVFEYEGETKERTLAIPVPSTSALLF